MLRAVASLGLRAWLTIHVEGFTIEKSKLRYLFLTLNAYDSYLPAQVKGPGEGHWT